MTVSLSCNWPQGEGFTWLTVSGNGARCFSLIAPDSQCGPNCPSYVALWEASFRRYADLRSARDCNVADMTFDLDGAAHTFLEFQRPLSLLLLPGEIGSYERVIGSKSMNMVRKALRAGYTAGSLNAQPYLSDIFEIRNSAPERRGYPIPEYWRQPAKLPVSNTGLCSRHFQRFYGAMRDGRLYAYCTLRVFGEVAQINHILGHRDHLAAGIMNLLMHEVVANLQAEFPLVKAINYLYSSNDSLGGFKRRLGFHPRQTLTTMAPPTLARRVEAAFHCKRDEAAPVVPARRAAPVPPPVLEEGLLWAGGPFIAQARRWPLEAVWAALTLPSDARLLFVSAAPPVREVVESLPPVWISVVSSLVDGELQAPYDVVALEGDASCCIESLGKGLARYGRLLSMGGLFLLRIPWRPTRARQTGQLDDAQLQVLSAFFEQRFRAADPDIATFARGFRGSDFQFRGLLDDSSNEADACGMGWMVLRKVRSSNPILGVRRPIVLDERDAPPGQRLAFPWILSRLRLPSGCRALDIGAGGFVGMSTTVHLCALGAQTTAIEISADRAAALQAAFPSIDVRCQDIRTYDWSGGPFDVVVIDLDSGLVPFVTKELIQTARPYLSPEGVLIAVIIYDSEATYGGDKPLLNPVGRKSQETFLRNFYGTSRVGVGAANRAVSRFGYEAIGVVDKYLGSAQRGVGWLVLRPVKGWG